MRKIETVYALNEGKYYQTCRPQHHPSIVDAREKNIRLGSIRCHELFKGQSYFKNQKEEELYKSYCSSQKVRSVGKSHMYKSELTNVQTTNQDFKPLANLNQLGLKISELLNRENLVQSLHEVRETGGKGRKLLDLIKSGEIKVYQTQEAESEEEYQQSISKFTPRAFNLSEGARKITEFPQIIQEKQIEGGQYREYKKKYSNLYNSVICGPTKRSFIEDTPRIDTKPKKNYTFMTKPGSALEQFEQLEGNRKRVFEAEEIDWKKEEKKQNQRLKKILALKEKQIGEYREFVSSVQNKFGKVGRFFKQFA